MKKGLSIALLAITSCAAIAAEVPTMAFVSSDQSSGTYDIQSTHQRMSYSLGVDVQRQFSRQALKMDVEAFLEGFKAAAYDYDLPVTDKTVQTDMVEWQRMALESRLAEKKDASEQNRVQGEKFLSSNRLRDEVTVLESGLQFEVITTGNGPAPKISDVVSVHYRGTLLDGTEFDSSYSRGEPAVFPVSGVIPGWTEALQKMTAGSKWKLYIPANLAYGNQAVGADIGPNSTLIFEVELLNVNS